MLELLVVILILAWLGGFSLHLGGQLVHLLLVVALVVAIVRLVQWRRL